MLASGHEACRPDGLYRTPGVDVPSCTVYDNGGREKMAIDRRIIGYFPSWRLGANGTPRYLAKDIPWGKITHINYAFAHIENNKISVGNVSDPNNASTGRTWPGVAGNTAACAQTGRPWRCASLVIRATSSAGRFA